MRFQLTYEELATFILVRPGRPLVGSTLDEVARAVDYWTTRTAYDASILRQWFIKEVPAHYVDVRSIYMMRFPLVNYLVQPDSGAEIADLLDHPHVVANSGAADAIVASITNRSGVPFRLPSEAEWEWAARADTRNEYPWGPTFDSNLCNSVESGLGTTSPVNRYLDGSSPFGIVDLAGNVEEWTLDTYSAYPDGFYVDDDISLRHAPKSYRVCKGGSFEAHGDLARVARRHGWIDGHMAFGVRLVVDADCVSSPGAAADALLRACRT